MTNPYAPPAVDAQAMVDEQETAQYGALAKAELSRILFAVRLAAVSGAALLCLLVIEMVIKGPGEPAYSTFLRLGAIIGYVTVYALLARAVREARDGLTQTSLENVFAQLIINLEFDIVATVVISLEQSYQTGAISLLPLAAIVLVEARHARALSRCVTLWFGVICVTSILAVADAAAENWLTGRVSILELALDLMPLPFMVAWVVTTRRYASTSTPPHLVRMLRGARRYWRAAAAVTVIGTGLTLMMLLT